MKKVILFTLVWLFTCGLATDISAKKRVKVKRTYHREIAAVDDVQNQINALNSLMQRARTTGAGCGSQPSCFAQTS